MKVCKYCGGRNICWDCGSCQDCQMKDVDIEEENYIKLSGEKLCQ